MKTKNLKEYTSVGSLYVSKELLKFVNNEVLKGTKIKPKNFWSGFEKSLHILKPKNEKLIDILSTFPCSSIIDRKRQSFTKKWK